MFKKKKRVHFHFFFLGQQVCEKMDEIKRYMKFRSVNRKLEQKVIKWLDKMPNDYFTKMRLN